MPKKKETKVDTEKKKEHTVDEEFVIEDDIQGEERKLVTIRKKLKECEKERQEYLAGWQRARADAINKAQEATLEKQQAVTRAVDEVYTSLFPILDSFDMAFSNKKLWEKVDEVWRTGVEHIYTQMTRSLQDAGITEIEAEGAVFNPTLHEPVDTEKVDTKDKDGIILTVLQKGYTSKNRVLRPAKVIIGTYNK